MEAVRSFNNELSSLYEVKPPVSRAKMAHVTKCAIKAIKFYKHVVQSVEKFILKCKPEYKVPGLYVIDSIVRQSRHQFGQEKDVYAPRFTKNIVTTFQNLFKCPTDERSKIVRVLNLWQKNAVFHMDVIQPLMDLAGDPTNVDLVASAQRAVDRLLPTPVKSSQQQQQLAGHVTKVEPPVAKPDTLINSQASADSILTTQTDMLNTVNQLLQQTQQPQSLDEQQQQLHQLQILQQQLLDQAQRMHPEQEQGPVIDNTLLAQIQTLTNQLLSKTNDLSKPPEPSFDKKLLDFDYGESDEDEDRKEEGGHNSSVGPVQHLLNDPAIMEHIQQMSQTIQKTEKLKNELNVQEQLRQQLLRQQQEEFDHQINQGPGRPHLPHLPPGLPPYPPGGDPPLPPDNSMDVDDVVIIQDDDGYQRDRLHRSRDRSRSPKRRHRSRSRSRDRRKRSRSRDRRRRSRSGDREKQREKDRERKKKGLPPLKEKHVSVCTTTIWLGHLSKLTSEEELVMELENYGAVDSINMIPPRGCAFVCMNRRKDAAEAVKRMKGVKIRSSAVKIAWATGKSIKDLDLKQYWNVELGVTYIPWDKMPADLSLLTDGGILDEDTLPPHLKELAAAVRQAEAGGEESQEGPPADSANATPQMGMPPQGPPNIHPPSQPGFPPQIPAMPANSIQVLQPAVRVMGPMMMPMSGQPTRMGLAGAPITPMGMPHILSMPGSGGPHNQVNTNPHGLPLPLMAVPNTSAGSQLSTAIQNIMSSSTGGPTAPTQAGPGMVRADFSGPRPAMFSQQMNHPRFNPNIPPPNFRLPPPNFSGSAQTVQALGDGDSTPEQDEGQATVTKVISNDWPSKYPSRDVDDRDTQRFPNPNFPQTPQGNRMQMTPEPKMLPHLQGGNQMLLHRGSAPPQFGPNTGVNVNSPRPLLGPRMLQQQQQHERPDVNGPLAPRFLLGGPQGSLLRPFGAGGPGNQNRPTGQGDGPRPLMGSPGGMLPRFGMGQRAPGQPLLGLRPGFPAGGRMVGAFQGRFPLNQASGPRPLLSGPMEDRMRPPFGEMQSPNRPFDRGFGDRLRFPNQRGGPGERPTIPDRWGPVDGPPGTEEPDEEFDDRGNRGDHGGHFDRFERNEFRRDGNRDWKMDRHEDRRDDRREERHEDRHHHRRSDQRDNRGDSRNHWGGAYEEEGDDNMEGEDEGPPNRDLGKDWPVNDKEESGRSRERDRSSRRSRWSNLDPSQKGERVLNLPDMGEESTENKGENVELNSDNNNKDNVELASSSENVELALRAENLKIQTDLEKDSKPVGQEPINTDNVDVETVPMQDSALTDISTEAKPSDTIVPVKMGDITPQEPPNVAERKVTDTQSQDNKVITDNGSTHSAEVKSIEYKSNRAAVEEPSVVAVSEKKESTVTVVVSEEKERSPMEEGELEPGEVSS